jgi:hypothetical protein
MAMTSLVKHVAFDDKVDRSTIVVKHMRRYRYRESRDSNYEHEYHVTVHHAMKSARRQADALSREVGTNTKTDAVSGKPELQAGSGKPDLPKSILKTVRSAMVVPGEGWLGPNEWLMDTGSSVDLVGTQNILDHYMQDAEDVENPIHLSTANGRLVAKQAINLQVGPFQDVVKPLLLKKHSTGFIGGETHQ